MKPIKTIWWAAVALGSLVALFLLFIIREQRIKVNKASTENKQIC